MWKDYVLLIVLYAVGVYAGYRLGFINALKMYNEYLKDKANKE